MRKFIHEFSKGEKLPVLTLILLCYVIKLITWIPPLKVNLSVGLPQTYTHLWESIFFAHANPVLSDVINGLSYLMGGDAYSFIFLNIFTYIFHIIATVFIYLAIRALDVRLSIAYIIGLIYSLILTRIDPPAWLGHDDLVYTLLPCYIWSLINYLKDPNSKYGISTGIFSSLLILTSAVPGIVSLFFLILATLAIKTSRGIFTYLKSIIIPISVILFICIKNYANIGLFTYATKGGANAAMFIKLQTHGLMMTFINLFRNRICQNGINGVTKI